MILRALLSQRAGLDSVSAMRVVQLLRQVANGSSDQTSEYSSLDRLPCTVITTIHQPSSQIFFAFDLISVLSKGHQFISVTPRTSYLTLPPGVVHVPLIIIPRITSWRLRLWTICPRVQAPNLPRSIQYVQTIPLEKI